MSSKTNSWLKKIFSVGTISLVVSILGLWIAAKTLLYDAGGELNISFKPSAELIAENPDAPIVIPNAKFYGFNQLLPVFSNPSKYVLKDFYLRFDITGTNFTGTPSAFYETIQGHDKITLIYRSERLPAGMTVEEPLETLEITGKNADVKVEILASFNGCSKPFQQTYTYHLTVADRGTQSIRSWQKSIPSNHNATNILVMDGDRLERVSIEAIQQPVAQVPQPKQSTTVTTTTEPYTSTTTAKEAATISTTTPTTIEDVQIQSEEPSIITGILAFIAIGLGVFIIIWGFGSIEEMWDAYMIIRKHNLTLKGNLKDFYLIECGINNDSSAFSRVFFNIMFYVTWFDIILGTAFAIFLIYVLTEKYIFS